MKIKKLIRAAAIVFVCVMAVEGVVASFDLQKKDVENKRVLIMADGKVLAEMRILRPGKLQLDFKNESLAKGANDSEMYICDGGGKLQYQGENKKMKFTLSAEKVQVEDIPDKKKEEK